MTEEQGEELRAEADRRLEEALERRAIRDPREVCRDHLRWLKDAAPERYREAVEYYESELVPGIAQGGLDPVDAWVGFAGTLAAWRGPGRRVAVDRTGATASEEAPDPAVRLVLHLLEGKASGGAAALVVAMPREMSAAQQATHDLLVAGRKQWEGPDPDDEGENGAAAPGSAPGGQGDGAVGAPAPESEHHTDEV